MTTDTSPTILAIRERVAPTPMETLSLMQELNRTCEQANAAMEAFDGYCEAHETVAALTTIVSAGVLLENASTLCADMALAVNWDEEHPPDEDDLAFLQRRLGPDDMPVPAPTKAQLQEVARTAVTAAIQLVRSDILGTIASDKKPETSLRLIGRYLDAEKFHERLAEHTLRELGLTE